MKENEGKKPIYKKWWFWALIILILLIIVGSNGNNNTNIVSSSNQISEEKRVETQNNKKEKTKINVGEEVASNNTKITFISASDYTEYNNYSSPKSGNKIVRAEFSFENISNSDISLSGLECYADGEKCEDYFSADDYKSPTLESLSSGKKVKAVVYYEVPTNAENVIIEYETNLWTSDKIEFIVK